jgi:hypothetical protein
MLIADSCPKQIIGPMFYTQVCHIHKVLTASIGASKNLLKKIPGVEIVLALPRDAR